MHARHLAIGLALVPGHGLYVVLPDDPVDAVVDRLNDVVLVRLCGGQDLALQRHCLALLRPGLGHRNGDVQLTQHRTGDQRPGTHREPRSFADRLLVLFRLLGSDVSEIADKLPGGLIPALATDAPRPALPNRIPRHHKRNHRHALASVPLRLSPRRASSSFRASPPVLGIPCSSIRLCNSCSACSCASSASVFWLSWPMPVATAPSSGSPCCRRRQTIW